MDSYELTDDEILQTIIDLQAENPVSRIVQMDDTDRAIAKAQRRKLLEWLDEMCKEHVSQIRHGKDYYSNKKRQCWRCWQSLLKEHGL